MEDHLASLNKRLINLENNIKESIIGVWWAKEHSNPFLISFNDLKKLSIDIQATNPIKEFTDYLNQRMEVEKTTLAMFEKNEEELTKVLQEFEEGLIQSIKDFKTRVLSEFSVCRKKITLSTDYMQTYIDNGFQTESELTEATKKLVSDIIELSDSDLSRFKQYNEEHINNPSRIKRVHGVTEKVKHVLDEKYNELIDSLKKELKIEHVVTAPAHPQPSTTIIHENVTEVKKPEQHVEVKATGNVQSNQTLKEEPPKVHEQERKEVTVHVEVESHQEKKSGVIVVEQVKTSDHSESPKKEEKPAHNLRPVEKVMEKVVQTVVHQEGKQAAASNSEEQKQNAPQQRGSFRKSPTKLQVFAGDIALKTSAIIQLEDEQMICDWVEKVVGEPKSFEVLYNTRDNGFTGFEFHKRCDNQGPTIIFVETTTGKRFGAYANSAWASNNKWITDEKCFLFSLDLKEVYHQKPGSTHSMFGLTSHGPRFGKSDLQIFDGCNKNQDSTFKPHTYDILNRTAHDIAGGHNYTVKAYEVWKVK